MCETAELTIVSVGRAAVFGTICAAAVSAFCSAAAWLLRMFSARSHCAGLTLKNENMLLRKLTAVLTAKSLLGPTRETQCSTVVMSICVIALRKALRVGRVSLHNSNVSCVSCCRGMLNCN